MEEYIESRMIERAPFNERGDCTVFALSVVADISYADAHVILSNAGRSRRRGFRFRRWLDNEAAQGRKLSFGGYTAEKVRMDRRVTLCQFLKDFPRGRFLVRKRGHVFAVLDGKPHDFPPQPGMRVRLTDVWYFHKETL